MDGGGWLRGNRQKEEGRPWGAFAWSLAAAAFPLGLWFAG